MNFGLATIQDEAGAALIQGTTVVPLAQFGENRGVLALLEDWPAVLPQLEQFAARASSAAGRKLDTATLAAPHIPRQIFCTGANYRRHVIGLIMGDESMRAPGDEAVTEEERRTRAEKMMDERAKSSLPFSFLKLPSCVVGPSDTVVLPGNVRKPDWELELGVVIGRRARHVTPEQAMAHVAGFAVVNDVTARDLVFRRDQSALGADWLSGKCFPTFLPFGPMIVPRQFVADPYDLNIHLSVNGRTFQDESTRDMMISIERQIAYLSDRVELLPGDLICTGSPYGNGAAFGVFLKPGDVMEGTITGLGMQRNPCAAEQVMS